MLCDNYAVHPIELIGDGLLFDASFVSIGEVHVFFIFIFSCIGKITSSPERTYKLINLSGYEEK